MLAHLVLFLLVTSVPARKHNRKHIQESSYSPPRQYRDYDDLQDYGEEYHYDYDRHQQDQQDRQHLQHDKQQLPPRNKLLVIVLDG